MRAPPTSYRLALKSLRNRAQLTLSACANAVDLSTTGFQRYENDKNFDAEPIPVRIIRGLIPLMVGKGNPPIEEAELWNLSEIRETAQAPIAPSKAPAWDSGDFSSLDGPKLPIRYEVERGVFRSANLAMPHYGTSAIAPSSSADQGRQWAARVLGPDGLNFRFPSGTLLHCVDVDAVPPTSVKDNAVAIARRTKDDLSEILLARIVELTGRRTATMRDSDGLEFTGEVLGLILFQYSRVD